MDRQSQLNWIEKQKNDLEQQINEHIKTFGNN